MSQNPFPRQGGQHGSREAILGQIKRALRIPAPRPGHHGPGQPGHKHKDNGQARPQASPNVPVGAVTQGQEPGLEQLAPPVTPGAAAKTGEAGAGGAQPGVLLSLNVLQGGPVWRQWLPATGNTPEEWIELFARNAEGLKAEFHLLEGEGELPGALAKLARESGWKKIGFHSHPLTDLARLQLDLPVVSTDEARYDKDDLAACDAGITACDCLVAQTGSVLLGALSAGGRALSVLPPHHVVVARKDQMLPDLPAAFALLHQAYGEQWPSSVSFITGPSRTGDIERILVLGAHGPKRLTIFLV